MIIDLLDRCMFFLKSILIYRNLWEYVCFIYGDIWGLYVVNLFVVLMGIYNRGLKDDFKCK